VNRRCSSSVQHWTITVPAASTSSESRPAELHSPVQRVVGQVEASDLGEDLRGVQVGVGERFKPGRVGFDERAGLVQQDRDGG
jgi:hypothetical protein